MSALGISRVEAQAAGRQQAVLDRRARKAILHPKEQCQQTLAHELRADCAVPGFKIKYPPFSSSPVSTPTASKRMQAQVIEHYVEQQRNKLKHGQGLAGLKPTWPFWLGAGAAVVAVGLVLRSKRE